MKQIVWIIVVAAVAACPLLSWGQMRVSPLWSDHAVVQAGQPVRVFGSAEPGDRITVQFADQSGQAVTDDAGGWSVELPALEPSSEPRDLTVEGPENSQTVSDLLVGEVWVCSGQSNMWWPVSRALNPDQEIALADHPKLRMFTVKQGTSDRPLATVDGKWEVAGPETVGDFSAVAYFFGRHLQQELGVPVGLVHASFSGSPIEAWVSRPTAEAHPVFDQIIQRWDRAVDTWEEPMAKTKHRRALAVYEKQKADGTLAQVNGRTPGAPAYKDLPNLIHRPANLHNAMIAPLTRLPIAGVVWYQGEANARAGAAYADMLTALISDWREAWGDPDMPFLGVQIPNFAPRQNRPMDSWWAELRGSQAAALTGPNTAMAVTIDIGEAGDIHPPNKQEVGRRLGLLALRDVYGKEIQASGPVFDSVRFEGGQAVVTFDHAETLTSTDSGAVQGFAIAGNDRKWVWADAEIDENTVRLSSDAVDQPVAVRYAWASNPDATLTNATGLPAAPFRTDDWPLVTQDKTWLPWLEEAESQMQGLRVPAVFSDQMVLQRDVKMPIWGWDEAGRQITVNAAGQTLQTQCDSDGTWRVELDPLEAGGPIELTITNDADEAVTVRDVLVGDVWLCSGQSNMQWPVSRSNDPERVAAGADHPRMRLMTIREASVDRPRRDIEGQWDICTPESVREFSAVGYHFGSGLLQELDVPIGLIDNALGGTRAEAWTSMAALEAEPALDPLLEKWQAYDAAWDADTELALYERRRAAWLPIYYEMRAAGQRPPRGPRLDSRRPDSRDHPANLYRGVVAPLTELPIRGVIWYQGESNANRAVQYRTLFPAMIRDWRQQWDDPDLPFIFVQIAGWGPVAEQPEEHMRAELREAQTAALDLPNTAMVTAVDVGDFDVHPIDKQTVGERLTQAALKLVYGKQVVANGPTFDAMQITGDTAQIQFDHLGGGLVAKDGQPLTGFAIAGEDRQFVWADAEIDGDIVVVQSDQVSEPVAVRYGWAGHPQMSLYNSEGFPALPFRTDDWPLTTQDRHGPWD